MRAEIKSTNFFQQSGPRLALGGILTDTKLYAMIDEERAATTQTQIQVISAYLSAYLLRRRAKSDCLPLLATYPWF